MSASSTVNASSAVRAEIIHLDHLIGRLQIRQCCCGVARAGRRILQRARSSQQAVEVGQLIDTGRDSSRARIRSSKPPALGTPRSGQSLRTRSRSLRNISASSMTTVSPKRPTLAGAARQQRRHQPQRTRRQVGVQLAQNIGPLRQLRADARPCKRQ